MIYMVILFGLADTGKILKVIFVGLTADTTPVIAEEITVSYLYNWRSLFSKGTCFKGLCKLIQFANTESYKHTNVCVCEIWWFCEWHSWSHYFPKFLLSQLDDDTAVNQLNIQRADDNSKYIYASTFSKIYRLPLDRCDRHNNPSNVTESCRQVKTFLLT